MADFVDEKRREMESRIKELRPLVDEFHRLEAAVSALAGVGTAAVGTAARTARSAATGTRKRTASRKRASSGTGKRGRPKGSGQRGKQALEIVRAKPGITIPEIAEAMGIKQNYLYRVMPGLQQDGLVSKKGKGWFAKAA